MKGGQSEQLASMEWEECYNSLFQMLVELKGCTKACKTKKYKNIKI